MTRERREVSSTGIYHVFVRGAGRRLLFEDEDDRLFFSERLFQYAEREKSRSIILAWCLMDNHVHILIRSELTSLETLMHSLGTSFARFYNGRHGHVGPVFQDRYKSIPVESDAQLLEAVRYIHHNPQVAGAHDYRDWKWSSFRAYLDGSPYLEEDIVLDMLGGKERFVAFHEDTANDQELMEFAVYDDVFMPKRTVISDGDALKIAKRLYGNEFANSIAALPEMERNTAIEHLRRMGLSVRQIERLTGIGRGIIQKCISSII